MCAIGVDVELTCERVKYFAAEEITINNIVPNTKPNPKFHSNDSKSSFVINPPPLFFLLVLCNTK